MKEETIEIDEEEYVPEQEEILEVTSNQNSYARIAGGKNRTINLDGISLQMENKVLIGEKKKKYD